jgi:hypothetical protein
MILQGIESPLKAILEQARWLCLTAEQQHDLRQIELRLRFDAIGLVTERELLEAEAERENISADGKLGLTPEQLAAIDDKTMKLRLAWLQAIKQAESMLSPEQKTKLQGHVPKLPSFELGPQITVAEDLDVRIADVIGARLKDTKVLEIEAAQAIADRLLGWGRSFALVVGIPLALLAIVLGALGIKTYSDFKSSVDTAQQRVKSFVDSAQERVKSSVETAQQRMLDQIDKVAKQTTQEFEERAANLREGYGKLEKQLTEIAALAPQVEGLSDRLQRLEQIQFGGTAAISSHIKKSLQKWIEEYRNYLAEIGYKVPKGTISINVDPSLTANAYYDSKQNRIVIDPKLLNDEEVIYREYTHRILEQTNVRTWNLASWKIASMVSGLSDYLPCSYLGRSQYGKKYVETFSKVLPEFAARGYLRDMHNDIKFVSDEETDPKKTEQHEAGQAWSGAFWEIRGALNCQPNAPRCVRADKVFVASWAEPLHVGPSNRVDERFVQSILRNVASLGDAAEVAKVRSIFERRGLKLP